MLIIPAIDLKDGEVVRYVKGRLNKKVYSSDPLKVARQWKKEGAELLHIVDLDGAMSGKQKNLAIIRKIISSLEIPVEVGGGIRDIETIDKILRMGAKRVVIGTKAIEDMDFLRGAIKKYGVRVALGLDLSSGHIGLYGWKKSSKLRLGGLLKSLKGLRLKTIIYTDISRDGTLSGINLRGIRKMLAFVSTIDLIASGGVSSLEDIKKLKGLRAINLKGVIVGKALYEGRFTLKEALSVAN